MVVKPLDFIVRGRRGLTQPLRGKREKVWVARWWEDVITADGTMGRVRRSIVIGTVEEFTTRRLAMQTENAPMSLLRSATRKVSAHSQV